MVGIDGGGDSGSGGAVPFTALIQIYAVECLNTIQTLVKAKVEK